MGIDFNWEGIKAIKDKRPNLGNSIDVSVYRLFEQSIRSSMVAKLGSEEADRIIYHAGEKAGQLFCINQLDTTLDFYPFIAQLQDQLRNLGIGILRVEESDINTLNMVITMEEDLDCFGLPDHGETICSYDEGFLSGIFSFYTHKAVKVKEIECWASGSQMCRFEVSKNE